MKQHSKTVVNKIMVGIFCAIIILGLAGTFLGKVFPQPELQENRTLARAPTIDDFSRPLELPNIITSYIADNFGFRKLLLWSYFQIRTRALHADFGLHSIEGKDGWLFVDAELPDYRRSKKLTSEELESIRARLDAWCNYGLSIGASTLLLVGPNKSTIYPDMMPDYFQSIGVVSRMDQVFDLKFNCPLIVIDPRKRLKAENDELLYYKWGTHWNGLAGLKVWQLIVSQLGSAGVERAWLPMYPVISSRQALPNEDSIWAWYGAEDPEIVNIPKVEFIPTDAIHRFGPSSPQPRILAIGDSFLQYIASIATGFFGSYALILPETTFSPGPEIGRLNALLFSRRQDFNIPETIKEFRPNLILLEVVERNIETLGKYVLPPGSYEIYDVTNSSWSRGVGTDVLKPSVVISHSKDGSRLRVGDKIVFRKSGERKITGITEVLPDRYTVLLDKSLDLTDGYPNFVSIVRLGSSGN